MSHYLGQATVGTNGDNGFIRNGTFAQLAHESQPAACGVTIGYGNLPKTFLYADNFAPATAHFSRGTEAFMQFDKGVKLGPRTMVTVSMFNGVPVPSFKKLADGDFEFEIRSLLETVVP